MKKYPLLFVALVSILVLSFSVIAFAAPSTTESAKVVHGKIIKIDDLNEHIEILTAAGNETLPLAKLVWVYRDQNAATITDLAVQDEVELILNSKNQVAYIKATSITGEQKEAEQGKENEEKQETPVEDKQNEQNQASENQQPESNIEKEPSTLETPFSEDEIEQLKIDIQDPNVKIKIDIKPDHPQHPFTVKIITKGSPTIHLSGADAEQFITQILGDLTTETLEQKDQLVEPFVSLFHLDPNKLKVHILVKANGQTDNYHYNLKNNKYKDELQVKNEVKVKETEKQKAKKDIINDEKKDLSKKELKKREHEEKKEMKKGKKEEKLEKQKQKHNNHKGAKKGDN